MPAGRPPKFKTVEDMQAAIDRYFEITPFEDQTILGLCLELDIDRDTLLNYQKKDEFFGTVKKAKDRIEHVWETRLAKKGRSGDIFALKNFGWRDSHDVNHGGQKDNPVQVVQFGSVDK